eukprot:3711844-Pyramimonas_sp.AAC.1
MALALPSLYVTTCGRGCEAYEIHSSDEMPSAVPRALLVPAYPAPPCVFECSHGRAPTDELGVGLQPWIEHDLQTFFEAIGLVFAQYEAERGIIFQVDSEESDPRTKRIFQGRQGYWSSEGER